MLRKMVVFLVFIKSCAGKYNFVKKPLRQVLESHYSHGRSATNTV